VLPLQLLASLLLLAASAFAFDDTVIDLVRRTVVSTTTTAAPTTTTTTTASTTTTTTVAGTTTTSTTVTTTTTTTDTTSTTTVTTTTSTTTTQTTLIDGEALYAGSDVSHAGTADFYMGQDGSATQTDVGAWWITGRAYTSISGTAATVAAPGAGKSWDLSLVYSESALSGTENCGDHVGSTVSTTLCSIAGTNKNCTFSVDLTTVHNFTGIAAGSCFQVHWTATSTPTSTSGSEVTIAAKEASGDGLSAFAASSTQTGATTAYMGPTASTTATELQTYFSVPKVVNACTGALALVNAPGSGKSWNYVVDVSTAAKTTSQSCKDLTYTSVTGCSIAGTNKQCTFSTLNGSMIVPAGGCLRLRRNPVSSPTTAGGATYAVECSANATETATTGGAILWGSSGTQFTASWNGGQTASTGSAHGNYWLTGGTAYTKCSGSYNSDAIGAGGGTFDIKISVSGTLTGTQTCTSGPTFTDTATLCTQTVGTDKGCSFTDVSVTVPINACIQVKAVKAGTVSTSPGDTQWSLTCEK
jgi:hypothetical protein